MFEIRLFTVFRPQRGRIKINYSLLIRPLRGRELPKIYSSNII